MDCKLILLTSCLCQLFFDCIDSSNKKMTFYSLETHHVSTDIILQRIADTALTSCQLLCEVNSACDHVGFSRDGSCILMRSYNPDKKKFLDAYLNETLILEKNSICCQRGENCERLNYQCCDAGFIGRSCSKNSSFSLKYEKQTIDVPITIKVVSREYQSMTISVWVKVLKKINDVITIFTISNLDKKQCKGLILECGRNGSLNIFGFNLSMNTGIRLKNNAWYHIMVASDGTKLDLFINAKHTITHKYTAIITNATRIQVTLGNEASRFHENKCQVEDKTRCFIGDLAHFYVKRKILSNKIARICTNKFTSASLYFHRFLETVNKKEIVVNKYTREIDNEMVKICET